MNLLSYHVTCTNLLCLFLESIEDTINQLLFKSRVNVSCTKVVHNLVRRERERERERERKKDSQINKLTKKRKKGKKTRSEKEKGRKGSSLADK